MGIAPKSAKPDPTAEAAAETPRPTIWKSTPLTDTFDRYKVTLTLRRPMLGTNPLDPEVLDTHILDRQRKIIAEQSRINKSINKYLDQLPISEAKGKAELERILAKIEEMYGAPLPEEHRELVLTGDLTALKETFAELDTKATTVFFWDKAAGRPCIGDHMIYGFLKAAAEAISRTKTSKKRGEVMAVASYTQSMINQYIRCDQEFITASQDIRRDPEGNPVYLHRSLRAMTAQGPRIALAKSEVLEAGTKFQFKLWVMKDAPIKGEHLAELFNYGQQSGLGQWRNSGRGTFTFEMEQIQ
jgi:hypothetical protein